MSFILYVIIYGKKSFPLVGKIQYGVDDESRHVDLGKNQSTLFRL